MNVPRLYRRIGLTAALAVLAVAALPSSASASDKDCADFPTQRAAQIFFLKHGGPQRDPHRLDGDDDGLACEDNPCPCYYKKHLPRNHLWQREFAFSSAYRN
ncbi:MAG TPA: excalibur calcium-binding domain-containing protein [Solirubrobacterales bacterium]